MKKCFLLLLLAVVSVFLLTACGCEHTWADATCLAPRTCTQCSKTEGEIGDHTWEAATCVAPKTCTVCSATEGDVVDHVWQEATCIALKTCTVCSEKEGKLGDHDLIPESLDGSKVTGSCRVCGKTVTQQAYDLEVVALQLLEGQWNAVKLQKVRQDIEENLSGTGQYLAFGADGTVTSTMSDFSGTGALTFDKSVGSVASYEMTINGEIYDVLLPSHMPNTVLVYTRGDYFVYTLEKD